MATYYLVISKFQTETSIVLLKVNTRSEIFYELHSERARLYRFNFLLGDTQLSGSVNCMAVTRTIHRTKEA
jgi:hypothetical protein